MGAPQKRKAPNSPAGAPSKKHNFGGNDTALAGHIKQSRVDHRQKRCWKRGRR